jgi:hypothetical protein
MNDVDRLITEAMMAFNTKMASAGDRFTRLSEAQRYLLRAVERAEQYVEHGGSLEEMNPRNGTTHSTGGKNLNGH